VVKNIMTFFILQYNLPGACNPCPSGPPAPTRFLLIAGGSNALEYEQRLIDFFDNPWDNKNTKKSGDGNE
jgi:hypothetical protein